MEGMRGIHKVQAKTPEINMLASWLELDFGGMRTSALGVLANFCVKWGIKRKNVLGAIRTRNRLLRKQVLYPLSYEDVSD